MPNPGPSVPCAVQARRQNQTALIVSSCLPALSHRGGVLRVFIDFLPALRRDENKKPPPASGAVLGYTLQSRFLSGHPVLSVAFGGLCGSMVSSFRKHATPTPEKALELQASLSQKSVSSSSGKCKHCLPTSPAS